MKRKRKKPDPEKHRYAPYHLRKRVYERDVGQCQYCGREVSFAECVMDHVYPFICGGRTRANNLVVACRSCNDLKFSQVIPPGYGPRDWHEGQLRKQASKRMKDTISIIQMAQADGIYLDDLFSEATQELWRA